MPIRPYENGDREAVMALWRDVFPYATGHNEPGLSIDRKTAVDDGLLLVATEEPTSTASTNADDRTIVGTVMGGYDGHRGWIYSLAVTPDARRRGVGSRLVQRIEQKLVERGAVKINLQIAPGNDDVIPFYESLGFVVEERISMGKKTD